MDETTELLLRVILIGVGATLVMDAWAAFLKLCFGTPCLNYAMVGRWLGHLPQGQFVHQNIGQARPVAGERALGWFAHYAIGVFFAGILLVAMGPTWGRDPTFLPAIAFGIISVVAPFFILQPGLGAGIAGSKTPQPTSTRWRSLMAHASFGVGLFAAAWVVSQLFPTSLF